MPKSITPEQLARVESGKKELRDPCVICGEPFNGGDCNHTVEETEVIFNIVGRLTQKERDEIRSRAVMRQA
jgi:hypothetical protein